MNVIKSIGSCLYNNLPDRKTVVSILRQVPGVINDYRDRTAAAFFAGYATVNGLSRSSDINLYLYFSSAFVASYCTVDLIQKAWARSQLESLSATTVPILPDSPSSVSPSLAEISNHYSSLELDDREIIFVIKPKVDHNGAFSLGIESNVQNLQRLRERYNVVTLQAGNIEEIQAAMIALSRPISHLIIEGHGDGQRIQLGSDSFINNGYTNRGIFQNLKPDAHILINSCLMGIPDAVAESFADHFSQAKIYASSSVGYTGRIWYYLDSEGKPALLNISFKRKELLTKVFQNQVTKDLDLEKELPILRPLAKRISDPTLIQFVEKEHQKRHPYKHFCEKVTGIFKRAA